MNYTKFLSSDVYYFVGSDLVVGGSARTVATSKITTARETARIGSDGRKLYQVNVNNGLNATSIIYVAADSVGIAELKESVDFSYITKTNIYSVANAKWQTGDSDIIINNDIITAVVDTTQMAGNVVLKSLRYVESQIPYRILISEGSSSFVVKTPTLIKGESTLVFHVDDDTDCVAFLTVNHSTGATKTYVTDVRYTGNNWNYWFRTNFNVQSGGFMPVLYDEDLDINKTYFINVNGEIVDSVYTYGALNWDTINYDATWAMDEDGDTATLYYFNGTTVKHNTFEGLLDYWIAPSSNTTKDGSTLFFTLQTDSEHLYILKGNGELVDVANVLLPLFENMNNVNYFSNPFAEYFVLYSWTYSDYWEDDILNKIVVLSQDGTILNVLDVSSYEIAQWDSEGFNPNGDYNGLYYNNWDNSIQWLIVNYCPHTNKFIVTTHERGNNYNDVNSYISYANYTNQFNSNRNSVSYVFYNYYNSNYNFINANYVDVVWLNHNSENFQKYTLADDQSFAFQRRDWENDAMYSDNPLMLGCLDGSEEYVKMYTFTESGVNITTTEWYYGDTSYVDTYDMIESSAVRLELNTTSDINWLFFNNQGVPSFITTTGDAWNMVRRGHAMVVIDNDDFNRNFIYHTTEGQINFPTTWNNYGDTGYDLEVNYDYGTFSPVRKTRLLIILIDNGNPRLFYRIDETGLLEAIGNNKADDGGYNDINLSDDSFNYFVYSDDYGTCWIYKYDWATGRCLSIENILTGGYDDSWSYGERFVVTEVVGSGAKFHFATRDGKKVMSVADNSSYYVSVNDYWWYD